MLVILKTISALILYPHLNHHHLSIYMLLERSSFNVEAIEQQKLHKHHDNTKTFTTIPVFVSNAMENTN